MVGVEGHRVHFYSKSCDVLLFELSSQMSLDESGLADTAITNEDEFEFSNNWGLIGGNHELHIFSKIGHTF